MLVLWQTPYGLSIRTRIAFACTRQDCAARMIFNLSPNLPTVEFAGPARQNEHRTGDRMSRHTKIVATLGPASSDLHTLERMVHAGVDVVRMNFSHGKPEDHVARAETIRDAAARAGRPVGILADLQGPKIRVGKFEDGRVTLTRDAAFILDARCELGNAQRVGLDYKDLPKDVKPGDVLLLDDGRLKLTVQRVVGHEIHTTVKVGGELSNNKGINRQGGGLTAPALTAKDMDDIRTAALIGVDFVAVSFPKSAADMYMARQLMRAAGKFPVEVVEAMSRVCLEAEKSYDTGLDREMLDRVFTRIDQSIAMAAIWRWKWATPRCRHCRRR